MVGPAPAALTYTPNGTGGGTGNDPNSFANDTNAQCAGEVEANRWTMRLATPEWKG